MAVAIREQEPLAQHTAFRIGGPARFFIEASGSNDVITAVRYATDRKLPWVVLGAGSNVLVSDRGFSGVVVHPVGGAIAVDGSTLQADAAVPLARVVAESVERGLRGLEWAVGIPGTVGGALCGNAGSFGSEMKDVVASVAVFDAKRDATLQFSAENCRFAYRESIFKGQPSLVILRTRFCLEPGDPAEIQKRVVQCAKVRLGSSSDPAGREFFTPGGRSSAQEVGVPTTGSVFKNVLWSRSGVDREELIRRFPELEAFRSNPGISAGFLIDQTGLRGRRVGGAVISEKHANFIINAGGATAGEVRSLIQLAKDEVLEKFGLRLEEEIRYIGFE